MRNEFGVPEILVDIGSLKLICVRHCRNRLDAICRTFFNMDAAVISLGGFMSQVLQFAAGIPQGRRFGVHPAGFG